MRKFVTADIHGADLALEQCLEMVDFDFEKDKLICLGDTCDGFPGVLNAFEILLRIKNLVYILGNHDEWAMHYYNGTWAKTFDQPDHRIWTDQGGKATLLSYNYKPMDKSHLDLMLSAKLYHEEDNMLFTHGGILEHERLEDTNKNVFLWDRDMLQRAVNVHPVNPDFKIHDYDIIFVGHTPVQWHNVRLKRKNHIILTEMDDQSCLPLHVCNVMGLDTGAGWNGKLTMMNIDTKEYWQSDNVLDLYPDYENRR